MNANEELVDELIKGGNLKEDQRILFKNLFDGTYAQGAKNERDKILIQINRINPRIESLLETIKAFTEEKDEEMKKLIESEFKELCYMVKTQQDRLNIFLKPKK